MSFAIFLLSCPKMMEIEARNEVHFAVICSTTDVIVVKDAVKLNALKVLIVTVK